jgi:hypothetical protein
MSLKEDEFGEACSTYAKDEKCIQHLVRIPGGETPLQRPWEDDIKVELKWRKTASRKVTLSVTLKENCTNLHEVYVCVNLRKNSDYFSERP